MPPKSPSKTPPRELVTILDFVRYAASRFTEAKLAFGQGTRDAIEDAMFLVCEVLRLPKDNAEAFLSARLTAAERRHVFGLIETRVRTRTPAAYLVKRAYLQDNAFYIDERAIVPRSYLAELLYGELFMGEEQLVDRMAVARGLGLCTGSGGGPSCLSHGGRPCARSLHRLGVSRDTRLRCLSQRASGCGRCVEGCAGGREDQRDGAWLGGARAADARRSVQAGGRHGLRRDPLQPALRGCGRHGALAGRVSARAAACARGRRRRARYRAAHPA